MFESFREDGPGRDLPAPGPELACRLVEATESAVYPPVSSWWELGPDGDEDDRADAPGRVARAAEDAAIERTSGWELLIAYAQASEMLEIDAAVRRAVDRAECAPFGAAPSAGDPSAAVESLTAEYALRWRVAQRTAAKRVDEAVGLVQGVRPAVDAMLGGRITLAHARALADVVLGLDPETARQVVETVLAGGVLRAPGQMSRAARREALRRDPDHAARRERKAHRERDVTLSSEPDGMATLHAYLPAAEALALYRTLTAHARRVPARSSGDTERTGATECTGATERTGATGCERRTLGARRADALTDLVAAGALIAAGLVPTPDAADSTADSTAGCESDSLQDDEPDLGAHLADEDAWLHDALSDDTRTWADEEADVSDLVDAEPSDPATGVDGVDDPRPADAATDDPGPGGLGGGSRGPSPFRPAPLPSARRVEVRVLVSADTLLGLDDRSAELPGYGPITAAYARRLAADHDVVLRRILTDPVDGSVLDVGHTRYRPPPSLARHVQDRATYCAFPGCRMPATACDLDHLRPYDPTTGSGPTAARNLAPECRTHHRIKGMPGWEVCREPDGTLLWTTPTGRRFRTLHEPLLPLRPARGTTERSRGDSAPTTTPTRVAA